MNTGPYIEADFCQLHKDGQNIAGDVFLSRKLQDGNRVVSVLADGLGSGVEACVLASLTARMALEYVTGNIETRRAAEIVMDALPLCPDRKISYSTFTIIDANIHGATRIIEHGNPQFLLVRDGQVIPVERSVLRADRWNGRSLAYSEFEVTFGDRIILFSDGIAQSGMGSSEYPLGWGIEKTSEYILNYIRKHPDVSARTLSQVMTNRARHNDGGRPGDDISCGVIYFRHPRRLLVMTGPPYDESLDRECALLIDRYKGHTVLCGGTTANIVARELDRSVTMDLSDIDKEIPTTSSMEGVDLITEGCLTLGKTAELLESNQMPAHENGATRLVNMLLQSDIIEFLVGTRVNEAHQNPNFPVELDIRRNVVKKIVRLLEEKYLKESRIDYV